MNAKRFLAQHPTRSALLAQADEGRSLELGQVLPIFVILAVVLLGGAALLTDVAWWWTQEQRMQRAADAGALAGAIYLPGREDLARLAARAETKKNGFVDGQGGVTVTPYADDEDPRKLIVDIDAPVKTTFAQVFCWDGGPCLRSVEVGVTGAASYVLPVPMGSPQNYYGVGYLVGANTRTTPGVTAWRPASAWKVTQSTSWSDHGDVYSDDGDRAATSTNGAVQNWGDFDITLPSGATVVGVEVRLNASVDRAGTTGCRFSVDLYNGSSPTAVGRQTLDLTDYNPAINRTDTDFDLGSSTDMWGHQDWTATELSNSNFRVRVTYNRPASCGATGRIDLVSVRAHYTATSTTLGQKDVVAPDGTVLDPQKFWGALQSQGAPNVQGDAYMTAYQSRSPTKIANDDDSGAPIYDPDGYYWYAIEFPDKADNGEVWLFDPGFCEVDTDTGTGETYTDSGANGAPFKPVSTFYDLWDTNGTPQDPKDDDLVYPAPAQDHAFRNSSWRDTVLDSGGVVQNPVACDDLEWHNDWVRIADGLDAGETYWLHTYSTDPANANAQSDVTALNAFAIWATASGGTPRVHGIGAMEAYVRLPQGVESKFYLAQIDAVHAGKTLEIRLWDPGDTGNLSAELQILRPDKDIYRETAFDYTAQRGSDDPNAKDCGNRSVDSGDNVMSVITNTGGNSNFNGCWLTITIPLDSKYAALNPDEDTVTDEGGWWKIKYIMGSGTRYATDLTTWEVRVLGNPVHLVRVPG